jgi:hypothetical protein
MVYFVLGGRGAEPSASLSSPLFSQGKWLDVEGGGGSLDSAPDLAADTHTDARFNNLNLNLSYALLCSRFSSRNKDSASTNIKYIKEHIEQRVEYGDRGIHLAPLRVATSTFCSIKHRSAAPRPHLSIKGESCAADRLDHFCLAPHLRPAKLKRTPTCL